MATEEAKREPGEGVSIPALGPAFLERIKGHILDTELPDPRNIAAALRGVAGLPVDALRRIRAASGREVRHTLARTAIALSFILGPVGAGLGALRVAEETFSPQPVPIALIASRYGEFYGDGQEIPVDAQVKISDVELDVVGQASYLIDDYTDAGPETYHATDPGPYDIYHLQVHDGRTNTMKAVDLIVARTPIPATSGHPPTDILSLLESISGGDVPIPPADATMRADRPNGEGLTAIGGYVRVAQFQRQIPGGSAEHGHPAFTEPQEVLLFTATA